MKLFYPLLPLRNRNQRYFIRHLCSSASAIFLLISVSLDGCGARGESEPTAESSASDSSAVAEKPVIHFGVISRYNPRIMFEEYQPIMDYLSRETSYRFELKLGKTYEDAVDFLGRGEVAIASLGAVTYLEAHKRFGALPILRPLNAQGKPYYHSLLIVRDESPVQSIDDLRGRSIAFASLHSTSGNLIPRYYLAQAGIHLRDLQRYENLKHHDSVAKAVLIGSFDAGAVKDIIGYKYLDLGLRILHKSEPIPSVPLVVRPDCDSSLIAAVKEALLKIDPDDSATRKMLTPWNEEFRHGFIVATDADYAILRRMMNAIPEKCGSSCHPPLEF